MNNAVTDTVPLIRPGLHVEILMDPDEIRQLASTLTPREGEVLRLLVDGKNAKFETLVLGSPYNAVRAQRTGTMKKIRADNIADPVRMTNPIEAPETIEEHSIAAVAEEFLLQYLLPPR
ncbi:MAG: hypothetical protein GY758_33040 [Fuerstiella sp.]|nr:hypothetical protein [Fuerstiella sp.]MCP4507158.1 hypothetical protein [Fuerstiella sp.]